jgi:magnesium chelatase accessory protein
MRRVPEWVVEGRDWPNRAASRFVDSGGLRWHVQQLGEGPALVLLHGTGAATHSWRDIAPLLARSHSVVAMDLPGHGFTRVPRDDSGFTLPNVARSVAALMSELGVVPFALVGHSAGAAIAVRMALDGLATPGGIVGLNSALLPFPGPLGPLAPFLARTMFYNPLMLALFGYRAGQPGAINGLIRSTGSSLDARGLDLYQRLFRTSSHLKSTMALMAHWDLDTLKRQLPQLQSPLTLIVGETDRAVPASVADAVRGLVPIATIVRAQGLGHLAHEEDPAKVAGLILRALAPSVS